MTDTFLWIYDDRNRDIALIRGLNVKQVLEAADVLQRARWSVDGKGWVVTRDDLAEVAAVAEYISVPYRVKQVRR